MKLKSINPQKRTTGLRQVFDRQANGRSEDKQWVHNDALVSHGLCIRRIEVDGVVLHSHVAEPDGVVLRERASPMVIELLANGEIFVQQSALNTSRGHFESPDEIVQAAMSW